MSADDPRHMAHALVLARRGLGNVWPNPAVGCVLVRDGRVIGRGWTQAGGRPHAEQVALAQAGARAEGATAYVTLEPCAHHGKTPPCAEALIAAGLSRVVTALTDPDTRVAGRGHAMLRQAGIEVTEHILIDQAAKLQAGFLTRLRLGRPFLTLKLALTIDGRIATASGESKWITGPEARRQVQGLRLRHDAVMVGGGTARADRPALNLRGLGSQRQPVRIVLSSRPLPELPAEDREHGPLWRLSGDLGDVMQEIAACGITRVLCEGGGVLAAGLLRADLVDELVIFTAGLALGADARPAIGDLQLLDLAAARRFQLVQTGQIGGDVVHRWTR